MYGAQGSSPKCFTEVQMLIQGPSDLLNRFSGSEFKVVNSTPLRVYRELLFQSHRCSQGTEQSFWKAVSLTMRKSW